MQQLILKTVTLLSSAPRSRSIETAYDTSALTLIHPFFAFFAEPFFSKGNY
jgi:hypothetical protein